jgi:hypothetical protein
VQAIERFVKHNQIPLVSFEKGQRKDEIAAAMRAQYPHREGVVFVGKAQEKCTVYRTEKRHNPKHNTSYAWIVKSTALVNHYYFYCVDENFGPFFLKFCSYFPYNAKLCLNGHEYAKRQLEREKIAYEALDNRRAVASKAVPVALYWPVGSLIEADSRRLGRGRRIHTRPPMVASPMRERGIHRAETYNWFRYARRIGRLTVAAQRRVSCRVDEDVIRVLDLVVRQFALLLFNGADEMAC